MSDVHCGIDWAEDHHDIALVARRGDLWRGDASMMTRPD